MARRRERSASSPRRTTARASLPARSNSLAGAIVLDTAAIVRPLVSGAGYVRTVSATLPSGTGLEAGTWFLIAVTDFDSAQTESSEENNSASAAISLTQPPRPDLAVVQVLAPATVTPGQPFNLIWAVTNRGGILATSLWSDSVAWSNAAAVVQELARFDFTNGLAADALVWRTQGVTLPINGPAGVLRLGVRADGLSELAEENEANNLALAANFTTVPSLLTLQLSLTQIAKTPRIHSSPAP